MLLHVFAFGCNCLKPDTALITRLFLRVVAITWKPSRSLPAASCTKVRTLIFQSVIDLADQRWSTSRPFVIGKHDGVFVLIQFNRTVNNILLRRIVRVTTRIKIPQIPFRFAVDDPFGYRFSCSTALTNTKTKATAMEKIWHTERRSNIRKPIRCIRDRAIDNTLHANATQYRHTGASLLDIPLEPIKIIRIQFVSKFFRNLAILPTRRCFPFIRPQYQTGLFLTQVIGVIRITYQRDETRQGFKLWNRFGNQILMLHRDHW